MGECLWKKVCITCGKVARGCGELLWITPMGSFPQGFSTGIQWVSTGIPQGFPQNFPQGEVKVENRF
jgi:hypothetical protein